MQIKANKCPNCQKKITNLKKSKFCRNCHAELQSVTVDGEKVYFDIGYTEEEINELLAQEDETEIVDEYETIYDRGDVTIKKNDKQKRIHVTHINTVYFGDMRCPNCNRLHFKNQTSHGTIEHKCNRCGYIVKYTFINEQNTRIA